MWIVKKSFKNEVQLQPMYNDKVQ